MKICLVSQEYPPETGGGGIGTQTFLKARGLSQRGHEVHVVSTSWDGTARCMQDGGATIHRIPEVVLNVPGFEQSTYWLAYSSAVAGKLHALSQEVAFDIMQFPEYCGEGFIYQTDSYVYRRAKYVVQLHGPLAMFREHMGWPERGGTLDEIGCFMERTVIHRADKVLASSHNTARFCSVEYEYPLEDIEVIHSAVDTAEFKPLSQERDGHFPRVLFVGNLVDSKGFTNTVRAILRLRSVYPQIQLRAIGRPDTHLVDAVKDQIAESSAEDNFDLVGYVPHSELPNHYRWCDFFAGPSVYEPGPGNTYLEAMACGRPVVACNSGGAPEAVLDGETGILTSPGNLDELVHAFQRLSAYETERRRLGANGQKWVESSFSVQSYIDKVEGIYKKLIGN